MQNDSHSERNSALHPQAALLADRQHGVIARRQLVALGLSVSAIDNWLSRGRLFPTRYRGVYAFGRPTLAREGRWMAAVLACGPGAVLSHRSAAALHRLRQNPARTDVTVPRGRRPTHKGLRTHMTTLHPEDITEVDAIPVTSVSRTLLDLAGVLDHDQLLRTADEAEALERFDLWSLQRAMERRPRARGINKLRHILADYQEPPDVRSEFERDFFELIAQAGLPRPQTNVVIAGLTVDVYWPQFGLVVELDSRTYHTRVRDFDRDHRRDAILMRLGLRVLRITWRRLRDEPQAVLDDVLALARRAA